MGKIYRSLWVVALATFPALAACRTTQGAQAVVRDASGTPGPTELATQKTAAGHGMVVFGKDTVYFYHLPMWSGVHAWQIVLEVALDANAMQLYQDDLAAGSKLNSFSPNSFKLASLAPGFAITGTLFHGHFEQGGTPLGGGDGAPATAVVKRILMVTPLKPTNPALTAPLYRVFGAGSEWYAAHVASRRPDYDQIVALSAPPPGDSDALMEGTTVTLAGPALKAPQRPKTGATFDARDATGAAFPFSVGAEAYFSTSYLGQ